MPPAPKEVGTRSRGGGGAGFAKGLYPPQGLCVYGYTADYAYTYVTWRLLGLIGNLSSETKAFLFMCRTIGHSFGQGFGQLVCMWFAEGVEQGLFYGLL